MDIRGEPVIASEYHASFGPSFSRHAIPNIAPETIDARKLEAASSNVPIPEYPMDASPREAALNIPVESHANRRTRRGSSAS